MPTKRLKRNRPLAAKITPAAVEAYQSGDRCELHDELRLKPWQASPLDVEGPCSYPEGSMIAISWSEIQALRAALEEMSNA